MKRLFTLVLLFLGITSMSAQIPGLGGPMGGGQIHPVTWSGAVEQAPDGSYNLIFKAKIQDGWHVFSQFTAPGGSLPMKIKYFKDSINYQTNGKTKESKTITRFNDVFDVKETIFENKAVLTQNITPKKENLRYVKAQMNYQVCQESCINEEYYFVFDLKEKKATVLTNYKQFMAFGNETNTASAKVTSTKKESSAKDEAAVVSAAAGASTGSDSLIDQSLWAIFITAFIAGFAALLTPCVFPMIPLTVSFFTKQSKTKAKGRSNALLYSFSIIVLYVLLGYIVTAIFGANALHGLSTNVTFNIIFFLLLVVFAVSFLGAFEIVLPSSWVNKVDQQANRGGVIGIIFMALALAIVSFSCTMPIVGAVLIGAATQGGLAPVVGMFGFSLALAIPFGLFAWFPGMMNSLPKSGGWLNSVKVVLGLLELAFAFKFLSNADMVTQSHLLPREIYLAIWIAIFGCMALYLFGKIQLPNDSKPDHISVGRFFMGMLALAFTIYLVPGIWGAPLKMLSGYTPPLTYSESPYGVGNTAPSLTSANTGATAPVDGRVVGPDGIMIFKDYEEGLAYAKKVNKPLMLDFTGMACVNCRKMEERVWSQPNVRSILTDNVVLVSLYVDVTKKLPKDEQFTSELTGKRITTVGEKWSNFQIERFRMNAQPYYVLLSPKTEKLLNKPVGYTPDANEYEAWLKDGIKSYKESQSDVVAVTPGI